jgi:hypothetical protein
MTSQNESRQVRRAAERADHKDGVSGRKPTPEPKYFGGKLNIYTCDTCRGHIVTRDMDEGVTPFMTSCHATEGCKGSMQSSMYRVFDQTMLESHQWFRPEITPDMKPHTRDHVSKGGLILRERAR